MARSTIVSLPRRKRMWIARLAGLEPTRRFEYLTPEPAPLETKKKKRNHRVGLTQRGTTPRLPVPVSQRLLESSIGMIDS